MSFVHYAVALSLLNFKVEWQLPVAVGVWCCFPVNPSHSTCRPSFWGGRRNCGPPNGVPHGAKREFQAMAQKKFFLVRLCVFFLGFLVLLGSCWFLLVVGGCGLLWVVVGCCGWLWVVVGCCGLLGLVGLLGLLGLLVLSVVGCCWCCWLLVVVGSWCCCLLVL